MRRRLARRLDVIEASWKVLENGILSAGNNAHIVYPNARVMQAVVNLENDLARFNNGGLWKSFYRTDEIKMMMTGQYSTDIAVDSLRRVREISENRDEFDGEQEDFVERQPFTDLWAAIDEYLEIAEVAQTSNGDSILRDQLNRLISALEDFESGLRVTAARDVRATWSTIRKLAPNAYSPLAAALLDHYFNYNLHVAVSESLIVPILTDQRTDNSPVRDFILGASVSGTQSTTVVTSADVKPDPNGIRIRLNLQGQTSSNTRGVRDPAVVFTRGNHTFQATKDIFFDGQMLTTSGTNLTVQPNNQTVGIRTKYDWIPILGDIVRGIASDEVRKKSGQSNAIAAQKLAQRLLPEVDQKASEEMAKYNGELQTNLYGRLRAADLYPSSLSVRSSETHIAISSRTMSTGRLGGSSPDALIAPHGGIAVQFHESLVNNFIDRLELSGKTLAESEITGYLSAVLTRLAGRPVTLPELDSPEPTSKAVDSDDDDDGKSESGEATFAFDATDPIRVEFEHRQINLILRTGLEQEGKPPVPPQEVRIPISFDLERGRFVLEADSPKILPLTRTSRFRQIAMAGQMQRVLKARLPKRELDAKYEVQLPGRPSRTFHVVSLDSGDGWVTIEVQ